MSNYKPMPELTERDVERFWSKIDIKGPDDCWEWTGARFNGGYGSFQFGAESLIIR